MPNRTVVPIVVVGIVHISPTLLLHNIFYVPQFNSNLLYVSVFLLHNNFFVTFLKNHFFIQQMSCSMSIGKGDLIKGLYVLVSPSDLDSEASTNICNFISIHEYNKSALACTNSASCKDPNIWLSQFGHVSNKVLKYLSNEISFNVSNDFSTSSCHMRPLAKFHRFSPSSNHISHNLFDLLHCDIWGPYAKSTYNGKKFFSL